MQKRLTVKELKAALVDVPDELEVHFGSDTEEAYEIVIEMARRVKYDLPMGSDSRTPGKPAWITLNRMAMLFRTRMDTLMVRMKRTLKTRLKKWLESEGIYPLGEPVDRMGTPPCGYWGKALGWRKVCEKRLPDMKIVVKGITLEVELKATNGTPSELQKRNIAQINHSGCFGFVLYPEGLKTSKKS